MEDLLKEALTSAKQYKEEEKDKGYVKWLFELSKKDIPTAGAKGALLAELYSQKFPTPPAFIITTHAFQKFTERVNNKIQEIINMTDVEKTEELIENSEEIRSIIESEELPKDMEKEILEAYEILGTERKDTKISGDALNILRIAKEPVFVAVRTSVTTEKQEESSFAGQQETYLNIKGASKLLQSVKKSFSSLYTPRAIYYRNKKGIKKPNTAVVVQKMINSEKSGVIFTKNPLEEDVLIEATFGLGEGIASGITQPDNYTTNKDLTILNKKTGEKETAITRNAAGETEEIKLTQERSNQQVLTDGQIKELTNIALRIEDQFKKPQDIEFAIERGNVYILQSRPITTLNQENKTTSEIQGKILLSGQPASSGVASGKVKIAKSTKDLAETKQGEVIVTRIAHPDMTIILGKSEAVITDQGGTTSPIAIIARELNTPLIVSTKNSTQTLKEDQEVTIDSNSGKIFEGKSEEEQKETSPIVKTKTEIKVIVNLPEYAEKAAKSKCNSVGLLKLERIVAGSGKHPLKFLKEKRIEDYKEFLAREISKITEHFDNIWIRTSDMKSDEYKHLEGSPKVELNPLLGFHGMRFSLKNRAILQAELQAIRKVSEKYPIKKIGVMFPQITSVKEATEARKELAKVRTENMEVGMMIETPAAVHITQELCDTDINFVSIGTDELTQYTLAVDKNNPEISHIYDEIHPSILRQIAIVINVCKKNGVKTSICGQAVNNPEMIRFLVKKGIDSITVKPDQALETSEIIKKTEEKLEEEQREEGTHVQAVTQDIEEDIEIPEPVEEIEETTTEEEPEKQTHKEKKKEEYIESQMQPENTEAEKTMVQENEPQEIIKETPTITTPEPPNPTIYESKVIKHPMPKTIEIIPDSFYTPQLQNIQNSIQEKIQQVKTGKIQQVHIPKTIIEKAEEIIKQPTNEEKPDFKKIEEKIHQLQEQVKQEEIEEQKEEQHLKELEEQGHQILDIF